MPVFIKEMEDLDLLKRIFEYVQQGLTREQIKGRIGLSMYKTCLLVPRAKEKFEKTSVTEKEKPAESKIPDGLAIKVYMDYEGVNTERLSRPGIMKKYNIPSKYRLEILIEQGRMDFNNFASKPENLDRFKDVLATAKKGDFTEIPPETLIEIQENIKTGVKTKQQYMDELGWSRNKLDKLMALKIEYFKEGEIASLAVSKQILKDMMPGTIFIFKNSEDTNIEDRSINRNYFVVSQNDLKTVVVDCSKLLKNVDSIKLEHIQTLLLLGDEVELDNESEVVACEFASGFAYDLKIILQAETLGQFIDREGNTIEISPDSNIIKEFIIRDIADKSYDLTEVDVTKTQRNNEQLLIKVSEKVYQERMSCDNKDLVPQSGGGYRVFSTATQIQMIELESGKQITVTKGSTGYDEVYRCLVMGDNNAAFLAAQGIKDISAYEGIHFKYSVGEGIVIKIKDVKVHPSISIIQNRVEHLLELGDYAALNALDNFIQKMFQNPLDDIIERIPHFMKFGDVQICEDGDLYVYKAVNKFYRDDYTNKIDNSVGATVYMDRSKIDPSTSATCTQGLHVCSLDYVNRMSGYSKVDSKIMRAKLSPADIVAIPQDYNARKIRCCKYYVSEDVTIAYHSGKIRADSKGAFATSEADKH